MNTLAPIALTMGDPAGIGGEISLMSWIKYKAELPPFYILDDPSRLDRLARMTDLKCRIEEIHSPGEAISIFVVILAMVLVPRELRLAQAMNEIEIFV